MSDVQNVRQGFFIIADISGYASFLTGSEFEHAQAIMEELTKLVVSHAKVPLRLVKLEGDAVFCYIPVEDLPEADRLLDHMESCYFDFLDHLAEMKMHTTCPCAACANMQQLDLKFVAHYGEYVVQRIAGTAEDLAGPDVILVHRLLKNRVVETTGTRAYALLTEATMARIGCLPGAKSHSESYDRFGVVNGSIHDLRVAYADMKESLCLKVSREEADVIHEGELSATPEMLWSYFMDPTRMLEWRGNIKTIQSKKNSSGRLGAGGEFHCAHGGFHRLTRILDAKPFQYMTSHSLHKPAWMIPDGIITFEFTPIDSERTRVSIRMRVTKRDPLTVFLTRKIAPKMLNQEMNFERLARAMANRN